MSACNPPEASHFREADFTVPIPLSEPSAIGKTLSRSLSSPIGALRSGVILLGRGVL